MKAGFKTNARDTAIVSVATGLVWSFSGSEYSYCSDIVNTKTVTNANGFKTAVQLIDLYPIIPAEASVKLQFFLHARVRVFQKTHHAFRKLIPVFAIMRKLSRNTRLT